MECPHLCESVKVNRDFIKIKKCELSKCSFNQTQNPTTNQSPTTVNSGTSNKLWKCLECTSDKENWMCLNCGQVLCGRYENGHALHHSTSNTQHNVCLNTLDCSVFCYKCDDYVINGKNLLDNLREEFKDDDSSSEASNSLDESSSVKSSSNQGSGSASASSSDSGCCDDGTIPSVGRRLRPRKRTNSNENGTESPTKKKQFRKAMGIRNAGNTCFMNAVLQALNHIQDFSLYFNALPSLETKPPKRVYYSRSMKENDDDINVTEELRKVIASLNQGDGTKSAISADCLFGVVFRFVPHFRGHRQHDAHEFLRYMLDRLHSELQCLPAATQIGSTTKVDSKVPGSSNGIEPTSISSRERGERKSSIVTNVFGGTLQSEVIILSTENRMRTENEKPIMQLSSYNKHPA